MFLYSRENIEFRALVFFSDSLKITLTLLRERLSLIIGSRRASVSSGCSLCELWLSAAVNKTGG